MSAAEKTKSPDDRVMLRRVARPNAAAARFQTRINGKLKVTYINEEMEVSRKEAEALIERYNHDSGHYRGVFFVYREADEDPQEAPASVEEQLRKQNADLVDMVGDMHSQMEAMKAQLAELKAGMSQAPMPQKQPTTDVPAPHKKGKGKK